VDDQLEMLSMMKSLLRRLGFNEVQGTTDPEEVMNHFERFDPDLVILDWHMPTINGDTVIRHLKRVIPRDVYLPILVLTGCPSPETRKEALLAGASDLLEKPFELAVGYMRIMNLLQIRELHRTVRLENEALESKVADRTRALEAKSAELQAALEKLQQSQEQLLRQERLRAFGEMAGGIVHDFNNSLMLVTGYSEVLLQNETMLKDTVKVRTFLEIMHAAGRDATKVIARLREFYQSPTKLDDLIPVDLNNLVEEAVLVTAPKWREEARARGREVLLSLDLARLPEVRGHAEELGCVLAYLIFKAVEAMPSGGALRIRTGGNEDGAELEVTDTGCGMTEEIRERCLEPFFTTKDQRGVGLGLSAAFGILQRHGATLEIESAPNQGTTCRIRFPVTKEAPPVAEVSPVSGRRILVVDDEPVLCELVRMYLEADSHFPISAVGGQEALALMEKSEFDLVISDMAMPGMSGAQLLAEIKSRRPGVATMLLSGFDVPGTPDAPQVWDAVLEKPVSRRQLSEAVAGVFAGGMAVASLA